MAFLFMGNGEPFCDAELACSGGTMMLVATRPVALSSSLEIMLI